MIKVRKIMRCIDVVDSDKPFLFAKVSAVRGQRFKVRSKRCRGDLKKILLTQTVVGI